MKFVKFQDTILEEHIIGPVHAIGPPHPTSEGAHGTPPVDASLKGDSYRNSAGAQGVAYSNIVLSLDPCSGGRLGGGGEGVAKARVCVDVGECWL